MRAIAKKMPNRRDHGFDSTPGTRAPEAAALVVTDGSLSARALRRFCVALERSLGLPVLDVRLGTVLRDDAGATLRAPEGSLPEDPVTAAITLTLDGIDSVRSIGLIGHAGGVNAILSSPVITRGEGGLPLADGTLTRSVARLAFVVPPAELATPVGIPPVPVLVQVGRPNEQHHPLVELAEEWTAAGTATRVVEYPGTARDWLSRPRRVKQAGQRVDDLAAFLARGLVNDGFDVIPAWDLR